jgi:rubrerythrin
MDEINTNVNDTNTPVDPTSHVPVNNSNSGKEYEVKKLLPEDLDKAWLRWKCLVCGYLYEGVTELKKCPRCGNEDPDKFDDAD